MWLLTPGFLQYASFHCTLCSKSLSDTHTHTHTLSLSLPPPPPNNQSSFVLFSPFGLPLTLCHIHMLTQTSQLCSLSPNDMSFIFTVAWTHEYPIKIVSCIWTNCVRVRTCVNLKCLCEVQSIIILNVCLTSTATSVEILHFHHFSTHTPWF
jgi:hypothetical protein